MTYGCFNRPPFEQSIRVQDGLTRDKLMEWVRYDPETGEFERKPRIGKSGRRLSGKPQARKRPSKEPYCKVYVDGKLYYAHRLAFLYMTGEWPAGLVDHIDGDGWNNRWANLRDATYQQNTQANHRGNRNNTSGFRGVYWNKQKQKWQAKIMVDRKEDHLGFYECPEKAHQAYIDRKAEVHFR